MHTFQREPLHEQTKNHTEQLRVKILMVAINSMVAKQKKTCQMEQPINILLTFANECVSEYDCQCMCVYSKVCLLQIKCPLQLTDTLVGSMGHIRMNLWHGGVSTFIIFQFSFKSSVFAKDTCSIYQSLRHHSCRTTP